MNSLKKCLATGIGLSGWVMFMATHIRADALPQAVPAPEYDWQSKTLPPTPAPTEIRVNSIGFLPDAKKQATVRGVSRDYRIVDLNTGAVVQTGKSLGQLTTRETDTGGELLSILDFSALTREGRYSIELEGGHRSAPFLIGPTVWDEPFRVVTRGMYLWRCGVAIDEKVAGRHYHQEACHLEDGYLDFIGGPAGTRRASVGGWHDAGDYNKYVVNAGVTTAFMFKAWEEFRPAVQKIGLGLPESGKGWPDLLAELRYEFDWLFTMQAEDGRVYHKLSAEYFNFWGMPDKDTARRYFTPWSTSATADFAAMMALGARHFREFDAAYADRCLVAARQAWAALLAQPTDVPADLKGFHTGAYQTKDPVHRLWAAAELWETTGESAFLAEFERRAQGETFTDKGPEWGDVRDLGLVTYLRSHRAGKSPALVAKLTSELLAQADAIVAQASDNAHARPLGDVRKTFYWGCNGAVAGQTYLLQAANAFAPKKAYVDTAADSLGYLFGRNYHARSYVTGLGYQPPEYTHDRRGTPQLPGYLVGGPFPTAVHWYDQWKDPSRNEIAINWNGALIYALAGFVSR